jgi:SAM-dependent methyltransferase
VNRPSPPAAPPIGSSVVWHDAECGAYGADLVVWERVAELCAGPILDLGAGTGRVALHLARRGHRVVAVDRAPELTAALGARAAAHDLPVTAVTADVRSFQRSSHFGLILAPMQLVHLLGGRRGRRMMLEAVEASLRPGGEFYAALLDDPLPPLGPPTPEAPPPLPDVREVDGWVHSSLPVAIRISDEAIAIERLRQLVSPQGTLTEELDVVRLDRLTPATFESEAEACGLRPLPRLPIIETDDHIGSVIVRLRGSE